MRITRESLLKIAQDTAAQRVRINRRLICIYLSGSLASTPVNAQSPAALNLENPLLGGTTDIDLIFVHDDDPPQEREIIRLTDEVHVDISHYPQRLFKDTRHLRQDPWLGGYLCLDPIVLHDQHHWFDFIQAAGCAQFMLPENILLRARPLIESARRRWMSLVNQPACTPLALYTYLKALEDAANAIAVIHGGPLTERRFFLYYPRRTEAVGRPGLAGGILDLIATQPLRTEDWQACLPQWAETYLAAAQTPACPPRLHPHRLSYYERAINELRTSLPAGAIWLLLRTWSLAACQLPQDHACLSSFQAACGKLGLDVDNFMSRLDGLDAYLDAVEETLDMWAVDNGIVPLSERL